MARKPLTQSFWCQSIRMMSQFLWILAEGQVLGYEFMKRQGPGRAPAQG